MLPPSGYPTIRGKACGEDWTNPTTVTGLLPNLGFGQQFTHVVEPITNNYPLIINIGDDHEEQQDYAALIQERIDQVRGLVQSHLVGDALRPTKEQRESIFWLLDHAEAELDAAEALWEKWMNRPGGAWPLSLGDTFNTFAGGACVNKSPGGRSGNFVCPTLAEALQRDKDRKAIGQRFSDAIAHVYCADYGYWRLRLFKEAYQAYKKLPSAGINDLQVTPGPATPQFPGPGDIQVSQKPIDPCAELGLDCPPGEEPPEDECPTGFCPPEAGTLPDPTDVPEMDGEGEIVVQPSQPLAKRIKPWHWVAAGGVVLGAGAITYGVISARR